MDTDLEALLLALKARLEVILAELEAAIHQDTRTDMDHKIFFDSIRTSLFHALTPSQVEGIEAKLQVFREEGLWISHAAYILATSYHETGAKMLPVREAPNADDAWRQRHLRYYPYYGRGDVQLTWLSGYQRADKELGLGGKLVANLDLALDKDVSAKIIVKGMVGGWFTGRTLMAKLPAVYGTRDQFISARKIVNGTDKAELIADYAIKFQTALKEANYGTPDNR